MALLPILQFPDSRLKLVAEPILEINVEVKTLAADMVETMYEENGVGLAAIQINVQQRMITIDCTKERKIPTVMINPKIVAADGNVTWEEGCLSFPGVYAKVKRHKNITVAYLDLDSQEQEIKADGLLSVCIQHEIDHLDGITFYDHLSSLKKSLLKKKIDKIRDKRL